MLVLKNGVHVTAVYLWQTGKQRRWDVIEAHSSVAVVLYHRDLDAFLLVRQFRPAVYSCRLREAKEAGQQPPDRAAGASACLGGGGSVVVVGVGRSRDMGRGRGGTELGEERTQCMHGLC